MKAIVSTAYGSPEVLQVSDIEKPTPKNNEVLIRVIASSVTAADGMMREGNPYYGRLFLGIFKPKYPISGTGLAGVVESVGSQVERFNIGDRVFGESVFGSGTNAEYVCVPADGIIEHMPDNISFIEAAPACDGAVTAYNFLTAVATLQKNQSILIIGASGSIGSSAVQIARQLGARVTGVCSTKNLDMVESLGAHELIDYTQTDFTQSSERYDVIFDTVGAMSYGRCRNSLHDKGIYLSPV
ncbi:MAG: NAD(P)-dependent alcohol dehydrogenase, partial [Granulosicoccus sp.]